MRKYNVTGMSCAACSARVEKAVSGVDGVEICNVNLLTNSMTVEGKAKDADIIKAVTDAGYGAKKANGEKNNNNEQAEDTETPKMKKRLVWSLIFLLCLIYFSMGHSMWGFPVPAFFENNPIANGILQMLLSGIVMVINQKFFISGAKGVKNRAPNMDTLVALGSGAAFVYSVYALFLMTKSTSPHEYMHEFYFESAAMILTLITVGKMLEAYSKGKTTNAIKSLLELTPKTALVLRDGIESEIPASDVKKGDIFIIKSGAHVPVDGIVSEGGASIDESALTGESMPVYKEKGSKVSAGTINVTGFLKCEATHTGEDTTLAKIIQMVTEASSDKAPIAKIADKVSGIFVPAVLIIALITFIIWLISGKTLGFAVARAISVLVISCPCALGLATPVAIMVGNGVGAKHGLLFKTATSLEQTGKATFVVLDKTGTITKGEPEVTDVLVADGIDEDEFLTLCYSIEKKSEHPLADAIIKIAESKGLNALASENFEIFAGNGLSADINGNKIYGGNLKFISQKAEIDDSIAKKAENLANDGKTPLFFSTDDKFLGIIATADNLKEDSKEAISELKNMGISAIMLTGDNEKTARAIAKKAGIDEVIAGVLPDGKEAEIKKLKDKGTVIMVGDGINDAPALTRADIGIAIGAGTDIAIESADIVLAKSTLLDVPAAIRLSRKTVKNIKENLFWAFIYNITGIPLAAGAYITLLGFTLSPMFGAAAMSLSSFCVVTNALRLNFVNVYDNKHDKKFKTKKEKKQMEKILKVEGMMCPHCEARVKTVLEELNEVIEAIPSHENKTVTIKLSSDISEEVLKEVIEKQGYKVL